MRCILQEAPKQFEVVVGVEDDAVTLPEVERKVPKAVAHAIRRVLRYAAVGLLKRSKGVDDGVGVVADGPGMIGESPNRVLHFPWVRWDGDVGLAGACGLENALAGRRHDDSASGVVIPDQIG